MADLEQAGCAVIRIDFRDPSDLGQEFFRWEMAAAVAGTYLGIHPFDQPDVEASKMAAGRIVSQPASGEPDWGDSLVETESLKIFSPASEVLGLPKHRPSTVECLSMLFEALQVGDYFAVLAYIDMEPGHWAILQDIRNAVRNQCRVATTIGYGPRFLHSAGQLHKGGPNTGVFLTITSDEPQDLSVSGHPYTFGAVKRAQAAGDLEVLTSRGRRVLHVQLRGASVADALESLHQTVREALDRSPPQT